MSDATRHGAVPPPVPSFPPPPPEFRVDVTGNKNSRIIVAAGSVTMTGKQQLPVADIPRAELDVVRRAWVDLSAGGDKVRTAGEAADRLAEGGPGMAVIAGPAGYGRRSVAVKALDEASRARETGSLVLREIRPDWEKPGQPDDSVLPDEPGTGYLLDVAAEIGAWINPVNAARRLMSYAERLLDVGSRLVVVADEHGWPEDASAVLARVVVRTKYRPSALQVARSHLEYVHHRPDRIRWLDTSPSGADPAGGAGHLLTATSRPADAARLASELAGADGSEEGLRTALGTFRQWRSDVQAAFEATEGNPDDRALLVAALFLNGKDALTVQGAARVLLGECRETSVRKILTGPDLTTRLERMGAQVDRRVVTLDHRPGYARAVLLHLWQQRADIHPPLLTWLDTITSPGEPGADRLAGISDLLVELAVAEDDIRVIEQIHAWIDNGDVSSGHRELIARVLTTAAEADPLGAKVRALLLDWAQASSEAITTVIALVCRGTFAEHYPRQALVRLRHILDRPEPDGAVRAAREALREIAGRGGQLPRVWSTVIKWATEKKHLAGHRAFLSLLDPREDPYVLQVMLVAAEQKADVKEALVEGWNAALTDSRVDAECRELLTAWARMRQSPETPKEIVTEILDVVVRRHLCTTPIAALIFGEAGVANDEAVIALRKDLSLPFALPAFQQDEPAPGGS